MPKADRTVGAIASHLPEMDVLVSSDGLSLRYTISISLALMMMTLSAAEYRVVLMVMTLGSTGR